MFMSQKEKARDADRIHAFSEPQTSSFRAPKDKLPGQPKEKQLPSQPKEKASPSISEEWEKLIIIDDDDFCTPATSSGAVVRPPIPILPSPVKPLDEKTSRILERLDIEELNPRIPTVVNRWNRASSEIVLFLWPLRKKAMFFSCRVFSCYSMKSQVEVLSQKWKSQFETRFTSFKIILKKILQ
jgi:hypothetical protein